MELLSSAGIAAALLLVHALLHLAWRAGQARRRRSGAAGPPPGALHRRATDRDGSSDRGIAAAVTAAAVVLALAAVAAFLESGYWVPLGGLGLLLSVIGLLLAWPRGRGLLILDVLIGLYVVLSLAGLLPSS